jgi:hypothetical protein
VRGRCTRASYEERGRFVVDVARGVAAVGGESHAQAEQLLLADGSRRENLWGGSYWPGRGRRECAECSAPLNLRPAQGNPGPDILDPALRSRVLDLTWALIGDGDALP